MRRSKRRNSNQIRKIIVGFVIFMILVLIGLIIFLLTVDIKDVRNHNGEQGATNNANENNIQEEIKISEYELIETSADGDIEVRLVDDTLMFSVKLEEVFKQNYPESVIDTSTKAGVTVHENVIEDICIGRIGEKNYLFVLTDKGSIGVMDIDEAVKTDVFRIKNKLISFDKPVIKVMSLNANLRIENSNTVIAITQDGKKYDLSKFVE